MTKSCCRPRDVGTLLLPSVGAQGPSSFHKRSMLSRRVAIASVRCGHGSRTRRGAASGDYLPLDKPGPYLPGNAAWARHAHRQTAAQKGELGGGRAGGGKGSRASGSTQRKARVAPCRSGGWERPAWGPPLTSLVSVLNLRFWMVLLSWMLVSSFIIWF